MQGNIIEPQVGTVKMTEEKGNLMNDGMMSLKPIKTKMEKKYGVCAEETEDALLSPSSRMFHEPNYNVHILGIIGWRAPEVLNWDLIKENLANTMLKQPRFSSLQVADKKDGRKIRWVPTEVDLDNHIIIPNLELSNYSSADELVDDYITTLSKTPMDMSKPLWEIHVLQLKSPSNSYSVFRFHHSLGDGVSLVQILLSCTRKTSDPDSPPDLPIPNIRKMNRQGKSEGYLWNSLMKMWFILRLFVNTMIDITLFFATALMLLRDSETPIRSSKVDNDSAHRRFIHCSVSLDDVKVVKSATNSTVNDVVLGVVQAGLSRYFTRRYGEGEDDKKDQAEKANKIPKGTKCRATVLINLRPLMAMNASNEMTENHIRLGNCFGFVLLPLKISKGNNNPLHYVSLAKSTMDRKKQSLEVILTSYVFDMVLNIFGFKAAASLARRVPLQTTLSFSNVMGPREEISFCGYPMTFLAATCYGQPTPLMIHVVSYTNKLTFAISVDERTIPDPYKFGDDFVDSLQDMKRAVLASTTTTAPLRI